MNRLSVLAGAGCLLLSACTQRFVDFTIISTKNFDLAKSAGFQKGKSRIEAEDKVHIIIFIPTGTPDMKNAIDKAIEKIPGCVALLDGVVYSKFWWIPYLYGQSSYVVEGTPLIDPSMVLNNVNELPDYAVIQFDKNGSIEDVKAVNKVDFAAIKEKVAGQGQAQKFKSSAALY